MTTQCVRRLFLALLALATATTLTWAAEPDPAVLSYQLSADAKWTDSKMYPGLKSTVLYGDPDKPGPYAVRNRFSPNTFSRPHFHPNDRIWTPPRLQAFRSLAMRYDCSRIFGL
jgi:hypothetical protein